MKKAKIILLVVEFTLVACLSMNYGLEHASMTSDTVLHSYYTIVIDAGHGGRDAGTVAADGTLEKDINLSIALALYDFVRVLGLQSVMLRDTDEQVYDPDESRDHSDLYTRLERINAVENAALVSIHQNHFTDESEWGLQVFYSPNDEESPLLADSIQLLNRKFLQSGNTRVTKESDDSYYILYRAEAPSVMVECGFMSNYAENNHLKDPRYQRLLACVIGVGILEWGVQIGEK